MILLLLLLLLLAVVEAAAPPPEDDDGDCNEDWNNASIPAGVADTGTPPKLLIILLPLPFAAAAAAAAACAANPAKMSSSMLSLCIYPIWEGGSSRLLELC